MRARSRRAAPSVPVPAWLAVLAALGVLYLVIPLAGMGAAVPWGRFGELIAGEASRDALWLSLRTCAAATATDLVLGVPLAVVLSRSWRGVRVVRILVALPLSLPPVVAGLALLATFGRRGLVGQVLEGAWGVRVGFTTLAVVMAQVFVSLPFLVITLEAALRSRPPGLAETAASLGAGPTRVLRTVTLPLVAPALARGTALSLARCLGEFGATLTFAGSLQGVTRTLPLQIYLARETDSDNALALGALLVVVAALVVAVTEWTPGRRSASVSEGEQAAAGPIGGGPARRLPAAPVSVDGGLSARDWRMRLRIPAGQVLAVMGHNGSGKSTLAEIVAGRLRLDSGALRIGDRLVDGERSFVEARRRGVTILGQDPHVFAHMSVLDNVAFPLRCRGVPRRRARQGAAEQLAAVGCAHLAARRGSQLSGGQAARVALARALALEPAVLILDEPTAALDVEASSHVTRVLAARLAGAGTTTILVTHDVLEALELADAMIVLDHGRLVEQGEPARLLARPASAFTARLAGLNIVDGPLVVGDDGLPGVAVGDRRLVAARLPEGVSLTAGDRVAMVFAPEAVSLYTEPPSGSPRSALPGSVEAADEAGGLVSVRLGLDGGADIRARVTTAAWAELGAPAGGRLWAVVKATQVRAVPLA
ncbi:ABC transporter permease [Propionibacterium australiense]|nr:ABC transporter permease [Propionibacterium australiense]